jgi:NAD(P)-dependent dehydrogenase (short-subunit alcohol dehydrogenase family)
LATTDDQARATGKSYDAVFEEVTSSAPRRRFVAPEDIAAAGVFLASDASRSITGEGMKSRRAWRCT